ncbi:MAG: DUF4959 domain-containing protein [Bacteroidales bacterium]|nr:DUF4959 domain-containing protein [Bacteroidales bacterium]
MKKICILLGAAVLVAACDLSGNEFGRLDQTNNVPAPSPVTVTGVRPINGGAVIKVSIPDDENIKGIIATYERGGETVNAKVSRYVDSLTVVGFADQAEHVVQVASFNVNEEQSSSVAVRFTPLPAAITTVSAELAQTFGGLKVRVHGNESHADMAVCILRDANMDDYGKPVSQMRWVEVTTLFTSSNDITLVRRGIEAEEAIFGVYFRDHWGNMTDTTIAILHPLEEVQLEKTKFRNAALADDNWVAGSTTNTYYPIERLWDGSGSSAYADGKYWFFATGDSPLPMWFTIDLGVQARLSRIATLPRIGYVIWQGAHPRDFEFWGSLAPTGESVPANEHGFDDSWFLLGRFQQFKPSGYAEDGTVGTITAEDSDYFNAGNDFEMDPDIEAHANDPLRYLRVVIVDTFGSYELKLNTYSLQFGEVTPYGQVLESYR